MKYFYPLLENTLSKEDLEAGIKVIKSEQLTMSKKTTEFEKQFAKKMGAKFALMVNSGANGLPHERLSVFFLSFLLFLQNQKIGRQKRFF